MAICKLLLILAITGVQTQQGLNAVRVTDVRTAKEWLMFPGNPSGPAIRAKAGESLVIVEFAWTDKLTGKDTGEDLEGFEVEDLAGKVYKSPIAEGDVREAPFLVPAPNQLRFFRAGGMTVDISALARKLVTPK